MHFRQIYLLIILTLIFITGCQKLTTDPGSDTSIQTQDGITYWGESYDEFGYGVYETADGGYAVVGSQYSTDTQEDLVLVKFDSSLKQEKKTSYSGAGLDSLYNNNANDIQQTADGGYITVGSTFNGSDYDVLIVKFSPDLKFAWQDTIQGTYHDYGNSIQQTSDGGYIICGTSYDGNDEDIMLWKITVTAGIPSYTIILSETTDNGTRDYGNYAQETSDGGYIIIGESATGIQVTKLTSGDTPILDTGFNGGASLTVGSAGDEGIFVQQLTDGNYIVLGNTEGGAGAQSQVYLNTISSVGVSVLTRTMGGSFDDKATSLMQTDDGGFVFTGKKHNETTHDNIWVVKLTPTLTTHWDKVYGGEYNDKGTSIKQTDDGGYIITGSSMSVAEKQSQIILLKIEEDGCVWSTDHTTKIACGL